MELSVANNAITKSWDAFWFLSGIYMKYTGCLEKLSAGPTWCIGVPLNARKLVPFASSRYVLYLDSTIAFFNIDYPSTYT